MKISQWLLIGVVLIFSSFVFTACSLNSRSTTNPVAPQSQGDDSVQTEVQNRDQAVSKSTEVQDLDRELSDFEVLEEDFSDL